MGRYCFFNTGMEYKFRFGEQPSEDILKFGGIPTFVYEGDHQHSWSNVDLKRIENTLRDLEDRLGLSKVDFTKYEKRLEGTYKLKAELDALTERSSHLSTYILGSIIYQQLFYSLNLNCTYES